MIEAGLLVGEGVHEVKEAVEIEAKHLARVGDDGLGVYPLEPHAAVALGVRIQEKLNPDLYDWFLEPGDR